MNIQEAISRLFDVSEKIQNVMDPDSPGGKKITIPEGISLGITALGLVPVFTKIGQLVTDWKSRDLGKKEDWMNEFRERFDLEDDELEEQIENLVNALLTFDQAFIRE